MGKQRSPSRRTGERLKRAKRLPAEIEGKTSPTPDVNDPQENLGHDLAVYRIELGMQREELRQSREFLEESHMRYLDLYENAPVGYLTLDEEGIVIEMNLTAARLLGIERTSLVKKPFSSLIAPESQDAFYLHTRGARHFPGTHACELTLEKIDGEGRVRHVQLESSAVEVHGAGVIRTALIDITRHKQMEEKLRASRLQLAVAADMARIAYWEHDEATDEFLFNDAFYTLYGTTAVREGGYRMSREEYGRRFVHPDDREALRRQAEENRARTRTRDIEQYEHRGVRRDGEIIYVLNRNKAVMDSKGRVFKTVGVNQDITASKKMEEEIRLLKHSIDIHYDGAYWMNTDNRFVYVNDAACQALGYEREELMEKTIYQVVPAATVEGMEGVWDRLRKGGSLVTESVSRRKDATEVPVEIVATYVQFAGHEYVCGFAHDISEKKRIEEQLRHAQKMEAVGTLAGGVAHDFNNILTVIMGLGSLMQMSIGKEDIHRPHIDQIVASSERAADLTRSLLAFSRKQRITLEPHKVKGIIASTAKLLTRLLPEDIDLEVNLSDGDAICLLDVTQIGQVLMNLATNARDAMPHGGSLSITTEGAQIDEAFEKKHGFGRKGEYVKLSVSDTGVGMDPTTVEHIFEPFFTTKGVGKGTGLGLASTYGIVKQHNGYIIVSSAPLKGTTFDIYLPVVDTPSPEKASPSPEAKGGTETILVVEDDRNVRNMLIEILKSRGYTTIEAVDGNDAIRVHRAHKESIDLVIIDVVMPGKNGKEAFDEIARTDPRVKAIFVSGYTGDIMVDKGIQKEGVDFLKKPIAVTALLAKVREVLDRGKEKGR